MQKCNKISSLPLECSFDRSLYLSMSYVYPSSNNKTMLVSSTNESNQENLDSNHADEPLFGQFPSPFFDDIPHNHHQHITNSTPNESPPSPPITKRVRKKRSAGKNDRHSKIHTAQGLRDRRMRLSLQIAHKFFGLQDMLGFDKASKTIEWLFCKSKKAIDEVTESIKSQRDTTQSPCRENIESCESPISDGEVDSEIEYFDATSNKGKQKVHDKIKDSEKSKKPTESELLARELRDKARARARERTRERMMINNHDKSKQVVGANPSDDFDQLQLGFSANPNDHYIGDSSSSLLEYSGMHHFYDHTQLNTNVAQKTEDYLGNAAASSSTYFSGYGYNKSFANPPAGWLDSSNTLLGLLGGWDSENFTENYGLLSNLAPSTGDIHGQSFSSVLNIPPSNHVQFENQNQRD